MSFTQVPNEALNRMTEISAGALRLYLFLLQCRNQTTGKCCPSVRVTAEAINVHPKNIFKLRNELTTAGWAQFTGDSVIGLLGIKSSKNATINTDSKRDAPQSSKNATIRAKGSKNATPESQKRYPEVAKTLPKGSKNATALIEEQYEGTILSEQYEGKARQKAAVPPAVAYIRQLTHRFPDKTLWPRIIQTLGEDFDRERLTSCYESWVSHGWNKMNLVWLFEWYTQGIPQGRANPKPGDPMAALTPNAQKTVVALESWLKRTEESEGT